MMMANKIAHSFHDLRGIPQLFQHFFCYGRAFPFLVFSGGAAVFLQAGLNADIVNDGRDLGKPLLRLGKALPLSNGLRKRVHL